MYDSLVVGGGIAGLAYATKMAQKGYEITVIEKAENIGDNVLCGGGFTNKATKAFPWLKKYTEEYDGRLIDKVEWKYDGKTLSMPETDMLVVDRGKLDNFLAKKAEENGAQIITGQKAERIKITKKDARVITKQKKYAGTTIVDASGSFGPIKGSGLYYPKKYGATLQWEYELGEEKTYQITGNKIQLVFQKETGNNDAGYAWIFPRKNGINLGAGSTQKVKGATKQLKYSIQKTIQDHVPELKPYTPDKKEGALLPHPSGTPSCLAVNRIITIGDASSAVNVQGEGNYYALLGASVAAEITDQKIGEEWFSLGKYSKTMLPLHRELGEDAEKMERLMGSSIVKKILFGLIPKSDYLVRKFTHKIRKSRLNTQQYNMLEI